MILQTVCHALTNGLRNRAPNPERDWIACRAGNSSTQRQKGRQLNISFSKTVNAAKHLLVALMTIVLLACSKPPFEFRGYSAGSECAAIIAAEISQGAELVGTRQEKIQGIGDLTVSELRGDVYSLPMFIEVVCHGESDPYGVWYLAVVNDLEAQAATYDRLTNILTQEFSAPTLAGDMGNREARFHCDAHGQVSLFEGGDEHLAGGGEVSIFIDLRSDLC